MHLHINGKKRTASVDPSRSLLGVLRNDFGLTGTKYGCGEGQCGACTVLIDGQPRRSCIIRVGTVRDAKIQTIEGLGTSAELHPIQQAFLEHNAMQCGYCIPGMVMSAAGLLNSKSKPSDQEILAAMTGNICRCGTYPRILRAIRQAATVLEGGQR